MAVNHALACFQSHKCAELERVANRFEFENPVAKQEKERIHEAIRTFASAIGCQISSEGGKQFARLVMVAIAEAAFEGGDIYEGLARTLVTLRPNK